jgi:glutathione S-transferase
VKLYGDLRGTNPRRVDLYLAEKGLRIERVQINSAASEQRQPDFLAKNPAGKIPVLEMDDGGFLPESAAIVEYLEERFPEPPMIGVTPEARAKVRSLERIGADLIGRAGIWLQHSHPHFAGRYRQDPVFGEVLGPTVDEVLEVLETHLGDKPFLAGDTLTIADCTLFALFQTCRVRLGFPFGAAYPGLDAWYARFAARPSAAYL